MIERQFVAQRIKEHQVQEFITKELGQTSHSRTEIKRTPLGEKIIVYTTRPGIVVGRKGENIKKLTLALKNKFKMENPQIEIGEIENPNLDANSVADRIAFTLERYGSKRFKSTGYKTLQSIIDAGALGAEIVISGKVPSSRAKTWRFSAGYLKKSGDISANHVEYAYSTAKLKTGIIGIQVSIMPAGLKLPDKVKIHEIKIEEIKPEERLKKITKEAEKQAVKEKPKKAPTKKKVEKKAPKKEAKKEIKE